MSLTEKQQEYLRNCNHRWNVKVGAVGSGKSFVDMAATIPKRLLAAKDEGLLVLMGNTRGTLERNILEPMRLIWPGLVGDIRSDNTIRLFGRKAYALGADNKKHVARIQGATFEYVYGDEIVTWSEDVFQMLKSRLRCEHSVFDGTCNPDKSSHWFKTFLDSDADIYLQTYTIDDNPHLPAAFVEGLKREYAGTVFEDRYIYGRWAASGILFKQAQYADDTELVADGVGHIDAAYGGADSTAFTVCCRKDSEYYVYGRLWQRHVDDCLPEIAADVERLRVGRIHNEDNGDKGYLAKELRRRGLRPQVYHEDMNKFLKITAYLIPTWKHVHFVPGTDPAYITQILDYGEDAEHDDAPDSLASLIRKQYFRRGDGGTVSRYGGVL